MRNFKSILKKLKKMWRKKRNWALVTVAAVTVGTGSAFALPFQPNVIEAGSNNQIQIILQKDYVCGKSTYDYAYVNEIPVQELKQQLSGWTMSSFDGTTAVFKRKVWDLAPECKNNAFFGLSHDGTLTLYKGPPENNEVIETFFQIDVEKLRSGITPEPVLQLYDGIKVTDMSDYNSILSMFSPFSTE